jgi:HAUS augmin-like complex subunit 3
MFSICSLIRDFLLIFSSDSKHALRAEVSDLEKKLASLEWQLDLLTSQATTITQRNKSRESAKTRATGQLTRLDDKLAKRSLEVNYSFILPT